MKDIKRPGGSTKVWDRLKRKYIKAKAAKKATKFIHKNNYNFFKNKLGLLLSINSVGNIPYMKEETLLAKQKTQYREKYLEYGKGLEMLTSVSESKENESKES